MYGGYTYGAPPFGPPPPPRGAREHDGFYLRLGLGVGRLAASFDSADSPSLGGRVEGGIASGALALEIALGGTPAPGLVIGGGLFTDGAGASTTHDLKVNGAGQRDLEFRNFGLALLGPFADFYVNPKLGFHVQGALGIAGMSVGEGRRGSQTITDAQSLGGLGFMLGGGYEWWVADQWSLGGIVRLMYASVQSDRRESERWNFRAIAVPEILFGATYH
jgi:hypothetical protein